MIDIEEKFFEMFGIKPEYKICPFHHCIYKKEYDCNNCDDREWKYPEITDRILLELICLLNSLHSYVVISDNFYELKDEVLNKLIQKPASMDVKQRVQDIIGRRGV